MRLAISVTAGTLAACLISLRFGLPVAVLGGWNVGGLVLLALAWLRIKSCNAASTAGRAAAEDPGRYAVYVIVVLTSAVSLLSATLLSRQARTIAPTEARELVALCLATVALSWALTHTSFTLRYAHLYYREDAEGVGGVEFPGGAPPTYFDFAYFAFTIGMCFQVSDTQVTSGQIRATALLHALISFAYNTAILAFVLNLAFGVQ